MQLEDAITATLLRSQLGLHDWDVGWGTFQIVKYTENRRIAKQAQAKIKLVTPGGTAGWPSPKASRRARPNEAAAATGWEPRVYEKQTPYAQVEVLSPVDLDDTGAGLCLYIQALSANRSIGRAPLAGRTCHGHRPHLRAGAAGEADGDGATAVATADCAPS